ncbi:hypothetical protein AB0D38_07840 [Streptomyces sp. NPDC048279]|uniref:hypothetical protein n=1 Tax=Streptomyces sp. NPDC048279 TaxID=3154714 RepID=UPI00342DD22E
MVRTRYEVSFESATGEVMGPCHERTGRIVLRLNGTALGALDVPPGPPHFILLTPTARPQIDTAGVLHLRWRQLGRGHVADPPAAFFVRLCHAGGTVVLRPAVSLTGDSYDRDLRGLPPSVPRPGHRHQRAPHLVRPAPAFPLPLRPPRLLPAETDGPVLHVQGQSPQHGLLTGAALTWQVDGSPTSLTGGPLDVRTLGAGTHALAVTATDPDGLTVTQELGPYNAATGLRVQPRPGL